MATRYLELPDLDLTLDLRWMGLPDDLEATLATQLKRAWRDLEALEGGAIANADEGRQVGHYWLRAPKLAPDAALTTAIDGLHAQIAAFTAEMSGRFPHVLQVGIGGSVLGPQLVVDALGTADDTRTVHFIDNTDPSGIARTLSGLDLAQTLVLVVSKSGGTPETRNGWLSTAAAYAAAGLDFAAHAVAVTGANSTLDVQAKAEGWLARFPMWDWVGGRTSVTAAVGLVPAALQGLDYAALLEGAAAMDAHTRVHDAATNPAALLALAWHHATEGDAKRAMVVLPYNDRLVLFSKYLQQLVMESIGKRLNRQGEVVHQGLAVYGNKGSTDQHAYVQQLRAGPDDFFMTFIEVLEDGDTNLEVDPGVRVGDYLSGFMAGTRAALSEVGKKSVTLTIPRVDARRLGALIALYERAVSLYASLVDVNAYHQPGVEAGKKAATKILATQAKLLAALARGATGDAWALAELTGADPRDAFHLLRHLAANGRVTAQGTGLKREFSVAS